MNPDMIEAAKKSAGLDTGPRSQGYLNPRQAQVEEPAEAETPEVAPERRNSISTRPIPVGAPGPRPTPTGGHEPHPEVPDHTREIRELADRAWLRLHG